MLDLWLIFSKIQTGEAFKECEIYKSEDCMGLVFWAMEVDKETDRYARRCRL